MEHSPNNPGSPTFVERRSNEEMRRIVDEKVAELDARRESNLKYKLEAIEKLFHITIETKSEALTIAVGRIQGEGTACAGRCREQVGKFYKEINELNAKAIRIKMILDTITKSELESNSRIAKVEDRLDTVEEEQIARGIRLGDVISKANETAERVDDVEEKCIARDVRLDAMTPKVDSNTARIYTLEVWKETDFKRSLIITVVSLITSVCLLVPVVVWIMDQFGGGL